MTQESNESPSKGNKFPKVNKTFNEHIKNFKNSKGAEFMKAAKKRKSESPDENDNQRTSKKAKVSSDSNSKNFFKNNKFNAESFQKPDWNKIKTETKQRKKERKQRNVGGQELYDSFHKAIKLWEELRHSTCAKSRRLELCRDVSRLFTGNVRTWIKQASGIRMIEHLVAYGDSDIRKSLFDEVSTKATILEIMKDTHSQHFLQKMLRHGNKEQRQTIIAATQGQVVRLTKHSIACQVIELAYTDFASAAQRATMMQEFFGPHFVYFKEEGIKSLADVLAKYPNKKEAIMKDLQNGLQTIMHKGIFNNTLILSLLKEYMIFCNQAEKQSVIEALEDGLLPVIHTRNGAHLAMHCLWNGTAKQRKTILKSFKEHLLKVATWDHSYLVLLAAMDCVDDTKLLSKVILDGLMKEKTELLNSEIGTRVFRYMILGRNSTYFHPDVINILKQGDGNPYSKKDASVRRQELVTHLSPALLEIILQNVAYWSRNCQWTLFLGPAIAALSTPEHKRKAMQALANHCGEKIPQGVNGLMDISHSSKMLNFIIGNDAENKKNKMPLFSMMFLKAAHQNLAEWLYCNRGCFVAVRLLETGIGRVIVPTRAIVMENIDKVEKIKKTAKGADILLRKMELTKDAVESEAEEDDDINESDDQCVAQDNGNKTISNEIEDDMNSGEDAVDGEAEEDTDNGDDDQEENVDINSDEDEDDDDQEAEVMEEDGDDEAEDDDDDDNDDDDDDEHDGEEEEAAEDEITFKKSK